MKMILRLTKFQQIVARFVQSCKNDIIKITEEQPFK